MTRDDIKNLFADATDEQITALLNQHHSELETSANKNKQNKAAIDEANKAAKEAREELEKLKNENLSAEEKLAKALSDAEATKAQYEANINRLAIEKKFAAAGVAEDDYKSILDSIVTSDADKSNTTADALLKMLSSQKNIVEKALKESLLDGTPKPGAAEGGEPNTPKPELTAAETVAMNLAKASSNNQKSSQDALAFYTGGNN